MATVKTLQKYIDRCNVVVKNNDSKAAKDLVKEILAVFNNEYPRLKFQLTRYSRTACSFYGLDPVANRSRCDDLKDLELLRSRLEMEIDKVKENNEMAKTTGDNNTIYINGNVTNAQFQQGSINSVQTQQVQLGIDFNEARKIIDEIGSYRENFTQTFGEQKGIELEQALKEADDAIKSEEPTRLKLAWNKIKSLAEGVSGNLIATGIVELLKTVPSLI